MVELDHLYEKFFHRLLILVLAAAIALRETQLVEHFSTSLDFPPALTELIQHSLEFGLPLTLVGLGSLAFRKFLWRWLRPELYVGGRWIGVSTYGDSVMPQAETTGGFIDTAKAQIHPPLITVVEFMQDMTSTSLRNGRAVFPSDSAATWFSTSLTIQNSDPLKMCMSYEVQSPPDPTVSAIERIVVYPSRRQARGSEWLSRSNRYPQMLKGEFGHAWNGEAKVLHYGYCYYARISASDLHKLESALRQCPCTDTEIKTVLDGMTYLHEADMASQFRVVMTKAIKVVVSET